MSIDIYGSTYEVIYRDRVIATFTHRELVKDETWMLIVQQLCTPGALLRLESDDREHVFKVDSVDHAWSEPLGFLIEGDPPDRRDCHIGKVYVTPYLRNVETGFGADVIGIV